MIREYEGRDMLSVISVWREASLASHPFMSKETLDKERAYIANTSIPYAEIWVYEEKREVVGFIAMFGKHVGGLFVRPDVQRKGIGGSLLRYVASLKGCPFTVEAFRENDAAMSFYRKQGFVDDMEYIHPETGRAVVRMIWRDNEI